VVILVIRSDEKTTIALTTAQSQAYIRDLDKDGGVPRRRPLAACDQYRQSLSPTI